MATDCLFVKVPYKSMWLQLLKTVELEHTHPKNTIIPLWAQCVPPPNRRDHIADVI